MPRIKTDLFESLGEMMRPPPVVPPKGAKGSADDFWTPKLNPVQMECFECEAQNVLAWGEKLSGKTTGLVHRVVRHCYENENALALILTPVKSMSEDGGAWHKLITSILPEWADGIGLNWKKSSDKQHNEVVWVQNIHGSFSQIKGISAPHPDQLADRFPGREPSCVFVDELTKCASVEYYSAPHAQLRRRPGVKGVQQYLAACNPEGRSSWVYKRFFIDPVNEETGEFDPNFVTIHVPLSDNIANLPPDAAKGLKDSYSHDPIEYARMIGGEWIDRASGDALFKDIYNPIIHVRPIGPDGRPSLKERLSPSAFYPFIIGLDPGSINNAFLFMQWLPIDGKMKWMFFDEVVTIRKRIDYHAFVPIIMRRVKWWREKIGGTASTCAQVWISDNSAFNQYHAGSGSYDVTELEKVYELHRERYGLESIRIKAAPKFNGSQIATVRQIQRLLSADEIVVSTGCPRVQKMFLQLESEDQKKNGEFNPSAAMTPKRCDLQHIFKAAGYVTLMSAMNPTALMPIKESTQTLTTVRAA